MSAPASVCLQTTVVLAVLFTATARCVAGVHAIISSPLILSMDITPAGVSCHDVASTWLAFFQECQQYRCAQGQVDLYWPLLSNREAIAGEHRRLLTTLLDNPPR